MKLYERLLPDERVCALPDGDDLVRVHLSDRSRAKYSVAGQSELVSDLSHQRRGQAERLLPDRVAVQTAKAER